MTQRRSSESATTCEIGVGGMDCASCAATIERALSHLDGVREVHVDVVGARARVRYAEGALTRRDLVTAIERVGYSVETTGEETVPPGSSPASSNVTTASLWHRRGRLTMTIAAGVSLGVGLALTWADAPRELPLALLAIATIAGGWFVIPRGLRAARDRALDMNFLMSVAAIGAWLIGEPEEAAATLFLFAVAELLESHSMDRVRNAVKALMQLAPASATIVRDGRQVRVPAADVAVGDTVLVKPGEKLPVDGEVIGGYSSVDQAPITGESMPVEKAVGDAVFAGSMNGHGMLEIRSSRPADDTTLARIIHTVERAQASRAPSQTFVERFARIYTPVVVGCALLIAVVPPAVGAGDWETWIYRALAMLVVACPCALVISTPVSIVSALTGAARGGVLIKGGVHLERTGVATTVCFDKTGTLTEGRLVVSDVLPMNGTPTNEVLRLALGVEQHSEHPLASAVLAEGRAREIEVPPSVQFESFPGRGARACIEDAMVLVGNARLLEQHSLLSPPVRDQLANVAREGKTAIAVAAASGAKGNGRFEVIGILALADRVRPNAASAIRRLRHAGIQRTVMLTGDNMETAHDVATSVGIDEVHAQLLPEEKVRVVRGLQSRGDRVIFVGDGVNDAPALAEASIGVAMGEGGTDVALETADIALMRNDLEQLAFAVQLSRKTLGIIRQNIVFSLAIKAVFLVMAIAGGATLWMAVAADMGGSLIVIANGLRARGVRMPSSS